MKSLFKTTVTNATAIFFSRERPRVSLPCVLLFPFPFQETPEKGRKLEEFLFLVFDFSLSHKWIKEWKDKSNQNGTLQGDSAIAPLNSIFRY